MYDYYFLKGSGIPLLCGCTRSPYCQSHVGQYELHTGFIAAIYNFSKEAFILSELRTIYFDDIQLNFNIDEENDLIMVLVHPINSNTTDIRKNLVTVHERFVNEFYEELQELVVKKNSYERFRQELHKMLKIEPGQVVSTLDMQLTLKVAITENVGLINN